MDIFDHIYAAVGDTPMASRAGGGNFIDTAASHVGEVSIELSAFRPLTSEQLGNRWRELTGPIPEATRVNFEFSMINAGEDVDVMLVGPNIEQLSGGCR